MGKHEFFVQPSTGNSSGTLYRFRLVSGRREIAESMMYSLIPTSAPRLAGAIGIYDFVKSHRTENEPPVFDIIRDLFPGHKEAIDRVEVEILKREFIKAVNPEGS